MTQERDASGKFVKGNSGNPKGRPPKEREQAYYDVLVTSVSEDDWRAIVTRAVSDAKKGDAVARKWLADYLIGPPIERKQIDANVNAEVVLKTVKGVSVDDL